MSDITMIVGYLHAVLTTGRQRQRADERGAQMVEYVLLAAGLAVGAIAVAAIIVAKMKSGAEAIPDK